MATRQGLLGRKVGMTQLIAESGEVVPVTVIEAGPCYVTQIKTQAKDGYNAIQIGFGAAKRLNKPELGHLRDLPRLRNLREIRTDDVDQYSVGQVVDVSQFDAGDLVDVVVLDPDGGKNVTLAESAALTSLDVPQDSNTASIGVAVKASTAHKIMNAQLHSPIVVLPAGVA